KDADKYPVSIYTLDYAIIHKIDPIIDNIIGHYRSNPKKFNEQTCVNLLTPLHISAIKGDKITTLKLLEAGADCNPLDRRRWTPLHHAAVLQDKEMIQLFISHGADVDAKTDEEGTYLDLSRLTQTALKSSEQAIPLFFKDQNIKNEQQLTAASYYQ